MTGSVGLTVEGLSHAYRGLRVLDGIDLSIPAGEVTVLVGPSGCGKSTLLGILGGLIAPEAGLIRLSGAVAEDCLNPLTFVFQDFALVPWRSVAGNVSLVLAHTRLSRADRAARIAEVKKETGAEKVRPAPWRRTTSREVAGAVEDVRKASRSRRPPAPGGGLGLVVVAE